MINRIMASLYVAIFSFAATTAAQDATEIKPGSKVIVENELSNENRWTIWVTHAEADKMFGIAEQSMNHLRTGYGQQTRELVSAEFQGNKSGMTLTLSQFDLLQDKQKTLLNWQGLLTNESGSFTPVPEQKNIIGNPVTCHFIIGDWDMATQEIKLLNSIPKEQFIVPRNVRQ